MDCLALYLSFYYSLILLYCLYDVLTNIYVYLFNVMSLMLSNEVGYNYDAATKGSRLNLLVQAVANTDMNDTFQQTK